MVSGLLATKISCYIQICKFQNYGL